MKRKLVLDIVERVLWTFAQGAAATLLLSGAFDIDTWKAAAIGGVAAVLSMLKGLAASRLGVLGTAATLPAAVIATGAVVGEVAGTVVDAAGEVVGEVTGVVAGTVGGVIGDVLGGKKK